MPSVCSPGDWRGEVSRAVAVVRLDREENISPVWIKIDTPRAIARVTGVGSGFYQASPLSWACTAMTYARPCRQKPQDHSSDVKFNIVCSAAFSHVVAQTGEICAVQNQRGAVTEERGTEICEVFGRVIPIAVPRIRIPE